MLPENARLLRDTLGHAVAVNLIEELKKAQMLFPVLFQFKKREWNEFRAWLLKNNFIEAARWVSDHVDTYNDAECLIPMQFLDFLSDPFFFYLRTHVIGENDLWFNGNLYMQGCWAAFTRHGLMYFAGPKDQEPHELMCTPDIAVILLQAMVTKTKNLAQCQIKLTKKLD